MAVNDSNRWLTLAFALPAQPAYARVKVWRRLQKVGAVPFKNALYWLPGTDAALEDFEWILREIRELGGEGLILESRALQGPMATSALSSSVRAKRTTPSSRAKRNRSSPLPNASAIRSM
jgi:hypothetical protein